MRRTVALSAVGRGGERARLPVNRAAFARVAVARGGGPSWVEVVGASGDISSGSAGIEGRLGPLDELEIRWYPEDRRQAADSLPFAEATWLWDARPLGDLIRMKLTHSGPDGLSALRIAMEPGLMVRRHSLPDVVHIGNEGTSARPELVFHVDPPIPKDVPIEVEFWRAATSGSGSRRWPAIDLPTVGKLTGLIGFRRPSDWSGRLESNGGVEPVSEASFAKSWGSLPDDGLTLAGAARNGRSTSFEVETRPVPLRRSIRTKVILALAPGRLDASIEGILSDRQGRSFDLVASIPNDLRIVRVEADGLMDWQRVARDRLRLQFDGSEAPGRRILIEAYLPVPADSVMSETRSFVAKVPWPLWDDVESTQGTLDIASPSRFQFDSSDGFAPLTTPSPTNPSGALYRSSYRVDRPSGPATVRWSSPPAKVSVEVESELAIDPTFLSWTASLTYDVSGGPAESLNLSMPTEWADAATLEIEGGTHRLDSQPTGLRGESTQWKILPDRPIWGRVRLVLRSKRPFRSGHEFGYPQVSPLAATGRGAVGRYDVAILNRSGRVMEVAGSSGLQSIEVAKFRPIDSPSSVARTIDRAYHVSGERWSLRLKVGRAGDEAASVPEVRKARVGFARLACVLEADGATSGRADYELEPRPGPFLAVRLPDGSEISWASVDGVIGQALVDTPGRWLIALGDGEPRRVILAWHRPAKGGLAGRMEPISFPSPDGSAPPTLISVEAPEDLILTSPEGGLERLGRVVWDLEDVEHLARRVVESLANFDRSSRDDREEILGDLTEIELKSRQFSRMANGEDRPDGPTAVRLQAALTSIAEASRVAGLDNLIQEARARIGAAPRGDDSVEGPMNWSPEVLRLRRSSLSYFFRSPEGDLGLAPMITRSEGVDHRRWWTTGSWAIAVVGIATWLTIGGLIVLDFRPSGRLAKGLVMLTTLALMPWEPIGVLLALGLFGWGRLSDR
jgi:hypothetical protein